MTVFLTTQYLEEADALADRVGIIDHGQIVAEGTPGGAQGRDRPARPSKRSRASPGELERAAPRCWTRFGERAGASPRGAAARLEGGEAQLADVVRALDDEGIAIEHLQLHAPSLDDVFLAKTGRSLEGAGEEAEEAEDGGGRRGVSSGLRTQVGQLARRSVRRTLRQPAQIVPALVFPLFLLAVNSSGLNARPTCPASRPTPTSPSPSPCPSCRGRCSR